MGSAKKRLSKVQRFVHLGIMGYCGVLWVLRRHLPFALDLVVQCEAKSVAHWLFSLGCWYYHHPSRGHSSIMMWFQKSDPTFNMGIEVRKKIKGCIDSKHMAMWQGLISTQRKVWKLISGPNPTAKTRQLPLTGYSPGLGPASLLDITPWEDTST
jgi:hypothetical protein